jgi:hypothetical protein
VGYLYTGFVVALSIMGKHFLEGRWERFKEREALKPQQMVLKRGVYVPWGPVQKIQRAGNIWLMAWGVYIVVLIGLAIYSRLIVGHDLI